MDSTELERRVLAQERILQLLIINLGDREPKFLNQLRANFSRHHVLGASENDFPETEQYIEQFIRRIELLRESKSP